MSFSFVSSMWLVSSFHIRCIIPKDSLLSKLINLKNWLISFLVAKSCPRKDSAFPHYPRCYPKMCINRTPKRPRLFNLLFMVVENPLISYSIKVIRFVLERDFRLCIMLCGRVS